MSREAPIKPEKDYREILDQALPEIDAVVERSLTEGMEKLLQLEKQTRQSSDLASSKRVLTKIVDVLVSKNEWKQLCEQLILLSKKHGQMKVAVQEMVKEVIAHLDETPNKQTKIDVIETIRTVTEAKMFVEVERAQVSRILAHIREEEGKIDEATDIMCELQVETFGSMELKEKVEFILEQIELCTKKGDFNQALILSKKILPKSLKTEAMQQLKLKYYELLVKIGLHDGRYLDIVQYYQQIYDTAVIQSDDGKWKSVLEKIVYFIVLAPYDNLQSDLIHKISLDTKLTNSDMTIPNQLLKSFTATELMNWPNMEKYYGEKLKGTDVFSPSTKEGAERWKDLRNRVIEHNIRTIAAYYSRITMTRLNTLLDLSESETEKFVSDLVINGTIYARINRPQRIVSFSKPRDSNDVLNQWSHNIGELLEHVETIGHLITKEQMMNGIKPVAS